MSAIKERLKKAFDGATLGGKLVTLNEEQATEFVTYLQDESKLLKKARFVKMKAPTKTIAKMFVNGKFLYPGTSGSIDRNKDTTFGTDVIELISKLVRGQFLVTDEELEDNIEGGKVGNKFIKLIAAKVANELEEIAIYGRKRANPLSTLEQFDGFKYLAMQNGHIVDASDTGVFTDRFVAKDKFNKAVKSIPTWYRAKAEFMVSSGTYIDYAELYDTIADSSVRSELKSLIAGKPFTQVDLMREDEAMVKPAGVSTTVASTASAGQKVIAVADATGITAGKVIVTNFGTEKEQTHVVASVSTTNITMVDNIAYEIASASTFKEVEKNAVDAFLTNPLNFIYAIQTNEALTFEIERVASIGWIYHFKMRGDMAIENPDAVALVQNLKIK